MEQENTSAFHRSISLNTKLIVITTIILLASLGIITWNSLSVFTSRTEQLVQGLTQNNAKSIAARIEAKFDGVVNFLLLIDTLKKTEAAKGISSNRDVLFAGAYTRGEKPGTLNAIYTISSEVSLKEAKLNTRQIENALKGYHPYFLRSFVNQIYVQNLSKELKLPVIAIAIPVTRNGNTASHVILAAVKIDSIDRAFAEEDITTSWLMNAEGEVIAHRDPQKTLQAVSLAESPYQKIISDMKTTSGFRHIKEDFNKEYVNEFFAFRILNKFNVTLGTMIPEEIALETVFIIRYRSLLIAGIVLLVAILAVFFFAKTISGPVNLLAKAAASIRAGDFNVRVTPKTRDEIGELSDSFNSMAQGLAEREQLKGALTKFVNPEIAERAMRGEISLGGERLNAAVFFSDIRSFTAISETMQPEQVVEFLNEYMSLMVKIINETDGVVDKFIGDAIMAVWGVPKSKGNDVKNAVNACLRMRESLAEFNKNRGTKDKPVIKIGCGLNYGPVLAGQIGSDDRLEYTVIGDTVNLASRVETLNKPLGTDILISSEVYTEVKNDFDCVPMQKIKVKGKSKPQQVYCVLRRKGDAKGPKNLAELRKRAQIDFDTKKKVDINKEEEKYELL